MAAEPMGAPPVPDPGSLAARAGSALRGFPGFAIAVAGSVLLIVALWLAANDAPSAAGEPFRFTPPPEPTATPAAAGERLGE